MRQEIGDDIGDLQKDKVHMKHGELEKWKSNFHSVDPFRRIPRLVDYVFLANHPTSSHRQLIQKTPSRMKSNSHTKRSHQ